MNSYYAVSDKGAVFHVKPGQYRQITDMMFIIDGQYYILDANLFHTEAWALELARQILLMKKLETEKNLKAIGQRLEALMQEAIHHEA